MAGPDLFQGQRFCVLPVSAESSFRCLASVVNNFMVVFVADFGCLFAVFLLSEPLVCIPGPRLVRKRPETDDFAFRSGALGDHLGSGQGPDNLAFTPRSHRPGSTREDKQ